MLGIDSVYCPMETRLKIWQRIATDFKPSNFEDFISQEISLDQLPTVLPNILKGHVRGRTIINIV